MSTVHATFSQVAARRGDADFLCVDSVTGRAYGIPPGPRSWREVETEVERLRLAYAQAGYGHGHRVGLLLENRPAFFTHWLALNSLGVSIVPLNADQRGAEWTYLIAHSEMCLAVVMPGREADLRSAASEAKVQLQTIRPEVAGKIPSPTMPARHAREPIGRASECALLYTSGTTGRPKGCRLANGYFLRAGEWYLGLHDLAEVVPNIDRFITPLPLSHMNALAFSSMAAILSGGCIVQLDRFHPSTWWQSVRESGATVMHYLGVMPAMLLAAPASDLDRQHNVRFGFGAGVDPGHHAAFEARFGIPLLEAWAMTETGAAACIMAHREPRHVGERCFGRAGAGVDTRIVDERGVDVGVDKAGELLVRASGADPRSDFFLDYLKDERATEEAWEGGWFHTGDVVRQSAEGDFYFVDRRKNVIRRSGENISAVEVEGVIDEHPAVAASAVTATPDPVRGDEVLACVVLRQAEHRPAPEKIASSIVRHVLSRLAYFKAPGYVAFVDALPLTASQKVQRGELREMARRLPGSPQCFDMRMLKSRQKRLGASTGQGALSGHGPLSGQGAPTGHGALTGPGPLSDSGALTDFGGLTEHGVSTGAAPLTEHGAPTEDDGILDFTGLTHPGARTAPGGLSPTVPGPLPPADDDTS